MSTSTPVPVVIEQARSVAVTTGGETVVVTQQLVDRFVVVTRGIPGPAGPPGPPGPGGGAGGASYEHQQTAAAAVWTVAHNLDRHPGVTVTDHLGQLIAPDVKYIDADIVQITHSVPMVGYAYFN
ncbi:MAG: hypothetical protein LBE61_09785 [Burkholderiaceae bacterium]|nr:hypothetical protein [Burkholderiaceae bacterium]